MSYSSENSVIINDEFIEIPEYIVAQKDYRREMHHRKSQRNI
jgi:hypothetical protein